MAQPWRTNSWFKVVMLVMLMADTQVMVVPQVTKLWLKVVMLNMVLSADIQIQVMP